MKKIMFFTLGFVLCLSFAVYAQDPVVWKIQGVWGANSIFSKNFQQYVVEPVNQELKGQVTFDFYPQNSEADQKKGAKKPVETNQGSFSAAKSGKRIAGMMQTPMYWGGADPVFPVIGDLVAAWRSPKDFVAWLDESGFQLLQDTYSKYNLYVVGYTLSPPENLVSLNPIRNIADLEGQKARAPRGMISDFFTRIKVKPKNIAAGRVKLAFEKKQISLADYSSLQTNLAGGLYDVAKHTNYPGFHSIAMIDFVVNKKMWDELPSESKQVITKHVKNWGTLCHENAIKLNEDSIEEIKAKGVTLHKWTPEALKEARTAAAEVWDLYAEEHGGAKEVIESIKNWLRKNNQL